MKIYGPTERQQFIDNILENAPVIIWSIDLEGRFTYTHGKGLENIGSKPGENIGKSVFDVYRGTDAANFIKKVLDGETFADIVKIGNFFYDTRVSVLTNHNGEKFGYMGVSLDVTEHIRDQSDLKKFRQALDQVPSAVYIIDKNMHFEYINPGFTDQSGYTEEDLLHRHVNATIYTGEIPESRLHVAEALMRGESWEGELYSRHKSGRMYWATTVASPYKDESGNIEGYLILQQDISKQKQLETELKESENLYRSLIENSLDGVVLTQDFKFILVNPVFLKMMGYTREELNQIDPSGILAPEDKERVIEYHKERLSGETKAQTYKASFIRKDGSRFIAELNSSSVIVNGRTASLVTMRDITQREQVQMELKIAKEALELLNRDLENRIIESSEKLTEANTQLISVQKENLQSQFEVLRQQVNPHFLFNSLNVLTSLIKLEPDLAEKFTEHLSKVYRYVLENKDHDLVSLNTELDFLDAYLFLLNIRFMDKIKVEINITVDKNGYLVLPLALQMVIENAIKHNSMSKKNPLAIKIFVDEQLMLNIVNNLQERESHMISTGVGLTNIAHRYDLLELPAPQFYKTETQFIAKIPLKAKE
jgi:PAS domain S-box-containing protein